MIHNYDECFDTESIYWKKVLAIFGANEQYPKKIVSDRNLHHKFPRSFSKKLGQPVDNDEDNLISLSLPDHFLVHYYYYKCAKKGYRASMALAFRFMSKKALKYVSDETVEMMAKDWAEIMKEAARHTSERLKGKKPKNFEYALRMAHEKNKKTEEHKNATKKRYYEEVLKPKAQAKRLEKERKYMRCIEFDEVHAVSFWRANGFRADKKDKNLSYYGLHFEYVFIKNKDWKETPISDEINNYLKTLKPNKHADVCDCCGRSVVGVNHVKLVLCTTGWKTLCYSCNNTVEYFNSITNKEEYNPEWVALFSKFLIVTN